MSLITDAMKEQRKEDNSLRAGIKPVQGGVTIEEGDFKMEIE